MCKSLKRTRTQGFTLVELSIVIIIIGFLIAGISAGTSLIKQAEVNSVITDLQSYQTSYNNFVLRYGAIPGDMKNADAYFANCAATNANCDGNGNGIIEPTSTGATADETIAAWRHLSLANMVGAGIAQIGTPASASAITLGSQAPLSKISGAGYMMIGGASGTATVIGSDGTSSPTVPWTDGVTNAVFIGKVSATSGLANAALTSQDAFNIDKKIDDGAVVVSGNNSFFIGADTGNFRSVTAADTTTAGTTTCFSGSAAGNNSNYTINSTLLACVSGLALN